MYRPDVSEHTTPLGFRSLSGHRVGIWGLGTEGLAAMRELIALGCDPSDIICVDDATAPGVKVDYLGSAQTTVSGAASSAPLDIYTSEFDRLYSCEYVIKSPGISLYSQRAVDLKDRGVVLCSGHSLWLGDLALAAQTPAGTHPIDETENDSHVGGVSGSPEAAALITGSKGKSTTTMLVRVILEAAGFEVGAFGNIGQPAFGRWDQNGQPLAAPRFVVLELSSYQCAQLEIGGDIFAVTSLSPDHLVWHGGLDRYYSDKLRVASLNGTGDVIISQNASPELRSYLAELAESPVLEVEADSSHVSTLDRLGLAGEHNLYNIALAHGVAQRLCGQKIDLTQLKFSSGDASLPARLTHVETVGGLDFYDDSLATNVLPAIAALRSFGRRATVQILGGSERGIDYADLLDAFISEAETGREIYVIGLDEPDNGGRIIADLAEREMSESLSFSVAQDLGEATVAAAEWGAERGAVVLLSPAAPSYSVSEDGVRSGRYRSYIEKGEAFAEEIAKLKTT